MDRTTELKCIKARKQYEVYRLRKAGLLPPLPRCPRCDAKITSDRWLPLCSRCARKAGLTPESHQRRRQHQPRHVRLLANQILEELRAEARRAG